MGNCSREVFTSSPVVNGKNLQHWCSLISAQPCLIFLKFNIFVFDKYLGMKESYSMIHFRNGSLAHLLLYSDELYLRRRLPVAFPSLFHTRWPWESSEFQDDRRCFFRKICEIVLWLCKCYKWTLEWIITTLLMWSWFEALSCCQPTTCSDK